MQCIHAVIVVSEAQRPHAPRDEICYLMCEVHAGMERGRSRCDPRSLRKPVPPISPPSRQLFLTISKGWRYEISLDSQAARPRRTQLPVWFNADNWWSRIVSLANRSASTWEILSNRLLFQEPPWAKNLLSTSHFYFKELLGIVRAVETLNEHVPQQYNHSSSIKAPCLMMEGTVQITFR